jgi:Ca-activated chloride channel family protein
MSLEDVRYLWLLGIIPLFLYFSIRSYRRSNVWLYAFTRKKKDASFNVLNTSLLCLSYIVITLSLAGPKVQYEKVVFNRSGITIVLGIDVSKSMLAEDVVLPVEGKKLFNVSNRLNRARYFCLDTLSELQGEWIGAYMFASSAVEVVPFTRDYGYCRYILEHINDTDITTPGSDLGEAIRAGVSLFEDPRSRKGVKILVLISDGEDISPDKSSLYESVKLAAFKGISIYTVGTGMGREALIPMRSNEGTFIIDYFLDEDGSYLKTRLSKDTLKDIASMTGGEYFQISDENASEQLMGAIVQKAKIYEQTRGVELAWFDLSPFFLFTGVLFFIVALFFDR